LFDQESATLTLDAEMEIETQSASGTIRSYRDLEDTIVIIKLDVWSEPQSIDQAFLQNTIISSFNLQRLEIKLADGISIPLSAFNSIQAPSAYRKPGNHLSQVHVFKLPDNEKALLGVGVTNKPSYVIPNIYKDAHYIQ